MNLYDPRKRICDSFFHVLSVKCYIYQIFYIASCAKRIKNTLILRTIVEKKDKMNEAPRLRQFDGTSSKGIVRERKRDREKERNREKQRKREPD